MIVSIVKSVQQFLKLVEETADPMSQGYPFIDITLLRVHYPAFSQLTEEQSIQIVRTLGFAVLPADSNEDIFDGDTAFSLVPEWDEEELKNQIKYISEKEGW